MDFNSSVSRLRARFPVAPPPDASPVAIPFDPEGPPIPWDEVFRRNAPLTVEIGTGNGVFLADEAQRHPEENFIGIEQAGEFFAKMTKRIERLGMKNVRTIRADAHEVFNVVLADGTVNRVICNFSDPWPKRRHRERRVFRPEFFLLLERALAPGGEVSFKTDVGWYFNLSIGALRRRRGWQVLEAGPVSVAPQEEAVPLTNFERKAREAESVVWAWRARWMGKDSLTETNHET